LAKELNVRLLAQIPLVASVCEGGDNGEPIALKDSIMGHEFIHLAHEVVDAVNDRNLNLPPTAKVNVNKK
jgi:ATP-binding protein involved in chromosome partitioning